MKRISLLAAVLLACLLAVPLHAQINVTTETTLAAAVSTTTQDIFSVASATGISAGNYMFVERELVRVTAVSSTNISVVRAEGGRATPHVNGSLVTVGTVGAYNARTGGSTGVFFAAVPFGSCTPGVQQYSVVVSTSNGGRYSCLADSWTQIGGIDQPLKEVTFHTHLNTGMVDNSFFVANQYYQVVAARAIYGTAGGSGCLIQLTKDTGTDVSGGGTDLLTNTSSTGFDCTATANTVQVGTFTATTTALRLAPGNRLSLDFAGTLTGLVDLTVTVTLKPL